MHESTIRDKLSENLGILEPRLQLIDKEVVVENPHGSGGRIDILARDQYGTLVIIELKRSDKAAREALHELLKYDSLLRLNEGLDRSRVRCLLVSTDWNELIRPFSELVTDSSLSIRGYKLTVDAAGNPISSNRIDPLPPIIVQSLSRNHTIWFFRDSLRLETALPYIKDGFPRFNLPNVFVAILKYSGQDPCVFPYAAYAAHTEIPEPEDDDIASQDDAELAQAIIDDPDSIPASLEDLRLSRICDGLRGKYDDMESGAPEKLATMLTVWTVLRVERYGSMAKPKVLPDKDAIEVMAEIATGVNALIFVHSATSSHESAWNALKRSTRKFLRKVPLWENEIIKRINMIQPGKDGHGSIWCRASKDLLSSLCYAARSRDITQLPRLDAIFEDSKETKYWLYGCLSWDHCTFPQISDPRIRCILDHPFCFTDSVSNIEFSSSILETHGLSYVLIELSEKTQNELHLIEGSDTLSPDLIGRKINSMADFFHANRRYIEELLAFYGSRVFRL